MGRSRPSSVLRSSGASAGIQETRSTGRRHSEGPTTATTLRTANSNDDATLSLVPGYGPGTVSPLLRLAGERRLPPLSSLMFVRILELGRHLVVPPNSRGLEARQSRAFFHLGSGIYGAQHAICSSH